jgi:hypothetical protein
MNFEFSDDLLQLRDRARRFLTSRCPSAENIIAERALGVPQNPRADKGLTFRDIPTGARK